MIALHYTQQHCSALYNVQCTVQSLFSHCTVTVDCSTLRALAKEQGRGQQGRDSWTSLNLIPHIKAPSPSFTPSVTTFPSNPPFPGQAASCLLPLFLLLPSGQAGCLGAGAGIGSCPAAPFRYPPSYLICLSKPNQSLNWISIKYLVTETPANLTSS